MAASVLVATAVMVSGPGRAQAQDAEAKDGLGGGKLRYHPGLFLEGGYDSNLFRQDTEEGPTSSPLILVRPKLGISLSNPTNVDLALNVGVAYTQYVASSDVVLEQSGLTAKVDGSVTFNPNGPVAFTVYEDFRRTNEQPNQDLFVQYDRIYNLAGGTLHVQPGGKLLTLDLGGGFELYRHDELTELDRNAVRLKATGKWKFFPKTSLQIDADQRFLLYNTKLRTPQGVGDNVPPYQEPFLTNGIQNSDSSPLRVLGGLAGLVLNRLSVVAMVGYGNSFYSDGPNFSGPLGRAEVAWEIGPTSRLRLGYQYGYADSTFSNYFTVHKLYGRYNHLFGGRFALRLEGDFDYRQFATNPGPTLDQVSVDNTPGAPAFSSSDRVDPVVKLLGEGVFRFSDFWRVGARYEADMNFSNFVFITGSVAANPTPGDVNTAGVALASYQKHTVVIFTGVEW